MEADGLRWSLLVIGSLVIAGLAIHGIWVSRKNNENKASAEKQKKAFLDEFESAGQTAKGDISEGHEDLSQTTDPQSTSEYNQDWSIDSIDSKQDPIFVEPQDAISEPDNSASSERPSPSAEKFDDLGLGPVRVVSSAPKQEAKTESKEETDENATSNTEQSDSANHNDIKAESKPSSKIYASVVTQPKPEYAAKYQSLAAETLAITQQERGEAANKKIKAKVSPADSFQQNYQAAGANEPNQVPEPPPFLLKKQDGAEAAEQPAAPSFVRPEAPTQAPEPAPEPEVNLAERLTLAEQARNLVKRKKTDTAKKRREPKLAEDQLRIDFDDMPNVEQPEEPSSNTSTTSNTSPEAPATEKPAEPMQPQEVLVLNVKVAEGQSISGATLLPMLLTLGFKFGDQDIFHRHVNSNGKGPVLFSLANMFKPGNFDIDNLENFTTQGISLFMILPIEGEPHQVFNMMHNAARKIAEEFDGQIYDAKRVLLTKQSLQQYVEKIREFERQRRLKR